MKRIYLLVIVFLFVSSFNINSMVIHGQLDDGFILKDGESQHLFFMGLDAVLFGQLHGTNGLNFIAIPFYNGGVGFKFNNYMIFLYGSPILFLPMVSLGYTARWQVNNKFEINFNTFISSPNAGISIALLMIGMSYLSNTWGPGISVGIGFKKKIKEEENSSLSYKFNLGIDYSGDLHGAISLKNSILIGIKKNNSILSLNPFINFCLKFGQTSFFPPSPSYGSGGWIVLEPGFELVSKVVGKNDFTFISTFMIGYELDFILMGSLFTYGGKLILSSSFGLGKKVISKEILLKKEN